MARVRSRRYVAIGKKDQSFFYKPYTVIKCRSGKIATLLCEHLNKNNGNLGEWNCKSNEMWYTYEELDPVHKLVMKDGKYTLVRV